MKLAYATDHVFSFGGRNHDVHGQHQAAFEQQFCSIAITAHTQRIELMNRPTTPLSDRSDTMFGEVCLEFMSSLRLNLKILEDIEVAGIRVRMRRQP